MQATTAPLRGIPCGHDVFDGQRTPGSLSVFRLFSKLWQAASQPVSKLFLPSR